MGFGGDTIWRKIVFAVLLIASLFWTGIAGASAADTGTAQTQAVINSTVSEKITQEPSIENIHTDPLNNSAVADPGTANTSDTSTALQFNVEAVNTTVLQSKSTPVNTSTALGSNTSSQVNNTLTEKAAAGTTKTETKFTLTQIKDAAKRVSAYVKTHKKLPSYVTIGTKQVQMTDFLKLLTTAVIHLESGDTSKITLKTINSALKPAEKLSNGQLTKKEYLVIAKKANTFINDHGRLPSYANSKLGTLRPETLTYMFSRVLSFQMTNHRLPSYVSVTSWAKTTAQAAGEAPIPDSLKKYLESTTNCQVTNADIKALAGSLTKGKTTNYSKAVAIFNWVNENVDYSFYYNTKRGAVGTLKNKTGNCVDTSHLLIALARAAGIPARYKHATCKFSSGTYGHVWAEIWVNGKWYSADATSSSNSFGVIKSWKLVTFKGTYTSLPF